MTLAALARDDASAQFLDAAAQGVLLYQRCSACGHAQLPIGGSVRTRCRNCGRNEAAWTPASGAATLVSWTSSPVRTADGTEPGPVIGLLELAEGPWMEAQLHALTGMPRSWLRARRSPWPSRPAPAARPSPSLFPLSNRPGAPC
jgi:uncharacterized OB-fold protein